MSGTIGLWSLRWSAAKGEHWRHERQCLPDAGEGWLALYREDEPDVTFTLSETKPIIKKDRNIT